jgi:uncharacterized protein YjiS (DUF1127 family)
LNTLLEYHTMPTVEDIRSYFTAWLDQRKARRLLASMDDRTLADIGLTRADVETAPGRSAPRDPALATCTTCQ